MKLTHRLLVAMAAATIGTAEAAHVCITNCPEKSCKVSNETAEQVKKKLTQAILDLGNKARKTRKAASLMLIKYGKSSLSYLEKASKSKDPEVNQEAKRIIAIINKAIAKPVLIVPRKDQCMKCGRG
ncbi:MAG: hypothetical protein HRT89_13360 [Lentisphaeria bacterium]|nr:hypothetical protein [Lentisphaeria bacterium]NQZ69045.1 hypothetical protein [Lentisphaeria bacterium]